MTEIIRFQIVLLGLAIGFVSIIVAGCSSEDVQEVLDGFVPENIVTFEEFEPNNTPEEANDISFWFPNDMLTTLHIRGDVNSAPNGDRYDAFKFVSSAGTYKFSLSELLSSDLDLVVLRDEALTSNSREEGVNYFPSPIDAPDQGRVESVTVNLSEGVLYYIRVEAIETNDLPHNYTVIVEKV